MLVVVQFPISDARPFSAGGGGRLDLPDWPPLAGVKPQFVRCFGPARRRKRGADAAWVDERTYCKANRALRFPRLPPPGNALGTKNRPMRLACAFRRLFSDGMAVARVEVGLKDWRFRVDERFLRGLDHGDCVAIARDVLGLQTEVPAPVGGLHRCELIRQGSSLARLYAHATTEAEQMGTDLARAALRLVEAGRPIVLLDYDATVLRSGTAISRLGPNKARGFSLEFHRVKPAHVGGADLSFGWLSTDYGAIGVWLLGRGTANPSQMRSLRLCLMRLHAEQEALDLVLRQLKRGRIVPRPGEAECDRLEEYFNDATRIINRKSWHGVSQSAILEAFDAARSVHYRDTTADLLRRYEGARRQVWKKIEAYELRRRAWREVPHITLGRGAILMQHHEQNISGGTFHGPVVNKIDAERIEDSFNNFASSNPSDDLKLAMATLHDDVQLLLAKMEEENVEGREGLTGRLEAFTEQAGKEAPLKDVLKVTGDGLIKAAKTVAGMVEPVTKAVKSVLTLLGFAGLI